MILIDVNINEIVVKTYNFLLILKFFQRNLVIKIDESNHKEKKTKAINT